LDDDSGVEMLRREIWALDPELPIPTVSTARTFLGASLAVPRFYSMLLSFFALLALVLAGVGVYGVVAHSVARRTREIGIRLALGAPASSVGAVLARDGLVAVLAGLAIGLIAGMVSSRLLAGLLYGVEPADPVTAASVGLVLLLVAGVAIALPAVRAMRANPIASLRID
jgi:putative ABC transport system permease protein